MIKIGGLGRISARALIAFCVVIALMVLWSLYKLGSLTGGLSANEVHAATAAVGWHGIYHQPFYLPLKLVRSVVFFLSPQHGQTLTRLPNSVIGLATIATFVALVRMWHSLRTAIFTGILFASGAWILHASRLASFDVIYLWALPTILLTNAVLYRYPKNGWAWYGSTLAWGLLLYVPGMIWLLGANLFFLKKQIKEAWAHFNTYKQRFPYFAFALIWLPLLVVDLLRSGQFLQWLGLPAHYDTVKVIGKHFLAVPLHLFIRGPDYPQIWLGKSPILDIFTLVTCLIGIQFYLTHLKAGRTRLLLSMALAGWILVALGGAVGLSLLVPLLYVVAATGIAYLLHEWLSVFPLNPLARGLGVGLICVAVALACVYNLRAYFVAWPRDATTKSIFRYYL